MSAKIHLLTDRGLVECGRRLVWLRWNKEDVLRVDGQDTFLSRHTEVRLTTTASWNTATCLQCKYWPVIRSAKTVVYGTRDAAYRRR
jgi:hypothetical protein